MRCQRNILSAIIVWYHDCDVCIFKFILTISDILTRINFKCFTQNNIRWQCLWQSVFGVSGFDKVYSVAVLLAKCTRWQWLWQSVFDDSAFGKVYSVTVPLAKCIRWQCLWQSVFGDSAFGKVYSVAVPLAKCIRWQCFWQSVFGDSVFGKVYSVIVPLAKCIRRIIPVPSMNNSLFGFKIISAYKQ